MKEGAAVNGPRKIKRAERVRSPEFAEWAKVAREHPCPDCYGIRKPCETCKGSRIDSTYAVLEESEEVQPSS